MTSQGVEVDVPSLAVGRRDQVVVLCVAGAVLVERLAAAVWVAPARRVLDNDEAVYFTAAAMVGRGRVPYREVTFAQPPGLVGLLALPARSLPVLDALAVGRVMAAVAGAVSVLLVGHLALRRYSVGPAVAAMVVMALFPAVALVDRSLLVEPWLNLFTVAAAVLWLGGAPAAWSVRRTSVVAGVALGVAATCKWWAVLLAVPMAVTLDGRRRTELVRVLGAATATVGFLLLPAVLLAPSDFVQQALRYQWSRTDGAALLDRLGPVLGVGTGVLALRDVLPTLVGLAALGLVATRADRGPVLRFGLVWCGLLVAAFLLGPYLGFHYTAHLAPALGLMAAPVAHWVLAARSTPSTATRAAAAVLAVAVLAVLVLDVRWVHGDAVASVPAPGAYGERVRAAGGAVHAPSPEVVLRAGRLPGVDRNGTVRFDPLAASAPGDYRRPRGVRPPLPGAAELVVLGPIDDVAPAQLADAGFAPVARDRAARVVVWGRSR